MCVCVYVLHRQIALLSCKEFKIFTPLTELTCNTLQNAGNVTTMLVNYS